MHVSALQHYVRSLVAALRASDGGKKAIDGLDAVDRMLQPFAGRPVDDLALLLMRADELEREGKISEALANAKAAGKPSRAGSSLKRAAGPADLTAVVDSLRGLRKKAGTEEMSATAIQEGMKVMDTPKKLLKGELLQVAKELGLAALTPKSSIADVRKAIQKMMEDSQASYQRTQPSPHEGAFAFKDA